MIKLRSQVFDRLFKQFPFGRSAADTFAGPKSTARAVRVLVLPDTCLVCRERRIGRLPLCAYCRRGLIPAEPADVDRSAAPWSELATLTAGWYLEPGSPARAVVHGLKYHGMPWLGAVIGEMLGHLVVTRTQPPRSPIGELAAIVPVPIQRVKLRERGYNQAERIAAGVSLVLGCPVADHLERPRTTASQTFRGRIERASASKEIFRMRNPRPLDGQRLLLVDDVFTTGATAAAAARTLLGAGAARVDVAVAGLTLARRY